MLVLIVYWQIYKLALSAMKMLIRNRLACLLLQSGECLGLMETTSVGHKLELCEE